MKSHCIPQYQTEKEKILGQFFTKESTIEKLLDILLEYKGYDKDIEILEPSFGTRNFIKVLSKRGFHKIDGCEIDPNLASNPQDFFDHSINKKYDLIIGNPPFTKYNIKESYYHINNYMNHSISPDTYLPTGLILKEKEKIENVFILKSIKHLNNENSSIAFILPISFFIKNRNKVVKTKISDIFSTIVIFQNKEVWFNYNIPCCFAIFTNEARFKDKIIMYYENSKRHKMVTNITNIYEELIPETFYHKKNGLTNNHSGIALENYLSHSKIIYNKSFKDNNISGKNILGKSTIPSTAQIEDYKLAVVRVGNASVGKCGLVNIKRDVLNDMFYVFDFVEKYKKNQKIKEKICNEINKNRDYLKNATCRVGSKSIKKEDIFNFRVPV